jgi:hypothetical protein
MGTAVVGDLREGSEGIQMEEVFTWTQAPGNEVVAIEMLGDPEKALKSVESRLETSK